MDSIEAAFAEKYPDLQEQYVLLPEMRSADPWSKVYRLNGGESCFAVAENYVYLSREGDVATAWRCCSDCWISNELHVG